jgi:outer membrane protein OmpA-like peptidoglycan-associated protein
MKNILFLALLTALHTSPAPASAQTVLEGFVFEENNRGYLRQVQITVYALPDMIVRAEIESDEEGHFSTLLPPGEYRLAAKKDVFFDREERFSIDTNKVFLKLEMRRKPGYLFDITIAEARESPDVVVDAVLGATIEIYNRTKNRPELVLKEYPEAFFQYTFEQGNHYTMMIRKPGFLAKRIEVYVNIKGCILCVDGVRTMTPGITENLTASNTMGTLLSNIELERARLDKRIVIQNIYYDFDKWDIRPDAAERLDNVVTLMNDNPGLSVELGSHTDSRGNDDYNMDLSDKRARAAVAYIVSEGIDSVRITAKGYGESQLANRCRNGVECSEAEHQLNRRTELRITGISGDSLEYKRWPSLEQIISEALHTKPSKKITAPKKSVIPNRSSPQKAEIRLPSRQMPEANNSVPLPKLEIPQKEDAEAALEEAALEENLDGVLLAEMPAPTPVRRIATDATPAPQVDTVLVKLTELAGNFNGFAVEIAHSDSLLAADSPVFGLFTEIYWQKEGENNFYYFTGNYSTPVGIRRFYKKTVKPQQPNARMVVFKKGKKSYFE